MDIGEVISISGKNSLDTEIENAGELLNTLSCPRVLLHIS
ncbi:hypothetical protein GXM_06431 [Nostoc sphaeroides CCNUC1]|uniref:Uncharacterized protein n=1 Tax=Nostoc sphaeroides CCNUC1 TaxID=2653204 RepID=A0A5P8W819_9NOSO|nr:hypothetical protein GXM_06431 [Nostoc sphaeroides CCNUC1]